MRLSDDQQALRASVRAVLAAPAEDVWTRLAEVGAPALLVPEHAGGLGAGLAEVHVVQYELGRTLAATPMLSSVLAAAALPPGPLLTEVAAGAVAALAWSDPTGSWTTCCTADHTGTLHGSAAYVLDGATATTLLAVARTGDELGVYRVPTADVRPTPGMDNRPLATAVFEGVAAEYLGPFDRARVRDVAWVALAAEQAGTAARCLELTVAYTKERRQFGRPIGSFQALQHRMADMHVLVETAESAALAAALAEPSERPLLAAVARAHCTEALRTVAAEMIQLHGGIAITWEHPAHRFLKRAHSTGELFGPVSEAVSRVADLTGL